MTIQHVAGAVRQWIMVGQDKAFCFGAQFENGFQDIARRVLLCPKAQRFGL